MKSIEKQINRKFSRSKMAGIILMKNLQALISVRVPLETLPTDGKRKFDSNNNDPECNYINSSGNINNNNNKNEFKYSYNNDNDDNNNSYNNKYFGEQ